MARLKQTIFQRDFAFMGLREDFLEGDDLDLRRASVKSIRNMRSLASRTIEQRPGTFFIRDIDPNALLFDIRLRDGTTYALIVAPNNLEVVGRDGEQVHSEISVPWSDPDDVWVEQFGNEVIIGGVFGLHVLAYDDGFWTFSEFAFTLGAGNETQQPYWSFIKDVTLQPSALSGDIEVVASSPIFTESYIGLRIRYNFREILVTDFVSPQRVLGTVVTSLPPSFSITVADAREFRVGDAVVGADTNYQGVVVSITDATLFVTTTAFFEGPDSGEELSCPTGSSKISGRTEIDPVPSPVWDEPLMSDVRGWPRSAAWASGRLFLMNFDQAPDVIAVSSARDYRDFGVGASDDDAIARSVGDNEPRWLHAVSMGDVLLLSSKGTYYIPTRDNGVLTPSTFNVVQADETSSSPVRPVRAEDGVVFVEAGGETLCAALLDGNIYLKWSVRTLSRFHNHVIKSPSRLCGPSLSGGTPEKYVFVVNSDGTLAALSWQESIRDERIGFVPWDTNGQFKSVAPILGEYWVVASRESGGTEVGLLERFSQEAFVDAAITKSATALEDLIEFNGEIFYADGEPIGLNLATQSHFRNVSVDIYADGWDAGTFETDADGVIINEPEFDGERQVGYAFTCSVSPWPVEVIESPRVGTLTARVLQMVVSTQNSLGFEAQCNSYSATIGAYRIGDDLTVAPVPRTQIYRFSVFGNRDHPELTIRRPRPGPLRILAIGQRVTA